MICKTAFRAIYTQALSTRQWIHKKESAYAMGQRHKCYIYTSSLRLGGTRPYVILMALTHGIYTKRLTRSDYVTGQSSMIPILENGKAIFRVKRGSLIQELVLI